MENTDGGSPTHGRPEGLWALVVGLFLFGLTIGFICSFSSTPGTTQSLLTALLTFVAGSIMTFAGFRDRIGTIRIHDIGMSLAGMSIGIATGIVSGIALKIFWYGALVNAGYTEEDATKYVKNISSLHGAASSTCRDIETQAENGAFSQETQQASYQQLRRLFGAVCERMLPEK